MFWGVKDNPSAALGSSFMTSMRLISFCDKATHSCFIPKYHRKTCPLCRRVRFSLTTYKETLSLINDNNQPLEN